MISLTALLGKNDAPSEAQLRGALVRHLCRCGTHMRILAAARRAVVLMRERK